MLPRCKEEQPEALRGDPICPPHSCYVVASVPGLVALQHLPHQHQRVPCTFFDFSASFCSFQIFYSEHPMLPESEMNSECCFYNLPRSFPRPNSPARPNHSPGHAWLAPVCPHATSSPSLGSLSREDRVCLYPRGQASRGQGWRVPPRVLLVVTGVAGGRGE